MGSEPLNQAASGQAADTEFRRRRVAILLFDDVEVLDFAGPFEVFSVARSVAGRAAFEVLTIALDPGEVTARGNLRVVPSCTASSVEGVDILVVPGGLGTRREMNRRATLSFIREVGHRAELILSVCTGALLLGTAGLLEGQGATTHWAAMDELRALDTGAEILPEARVVDNGRLVVSAGVSAGIDAALYIVGRLLGPAAAEATARQMQYERAGSGTQHSTVVVRTGA